MTRLERRRREGRRKKCKRLTILPFSKYGLIWFLFLFLFLKIFPRCYIPIFDGLVLDAEQPDQCGLWCWRCATLRAGLPEDFRRRLVWPSKWQTMICSLWWFCELLWFASFDHQVCVKENVFWHQIKNTIQVLSLKLSQVAKCFNFNRKGISPLGTLPEKNTTLVGNFSQYGGGSSQFPKLL